jgi:D-xylose 1-dehydrogenase (NADP+, D-xylono-1,5-lactone-forming)
VLGTANIARKAVIPAIHASNDNELVAVASREAGRAERFATEVGAPRSHGSYEALLSDEQVDAVYVPLPNALHAEWTVRALEAGKHVLCEKPSRRARPSAAACTPPPTRPACSLMEAFMYRHHPRTQRLLELVHGGGARRAALVWRILLVLRARPGQRTARRRARRGRADGRRLLRRRRRAGPRRRRARPGPSARRVGADRASTRRWSAACASRTAWWRRSPARSRRCARETVEVVGSSARLRVTRAFLPGSAACEALLERAHGAPERLEFPGVDQYRLMTEAFERSVRTGELPTLGQDGAMNLRAIEGLYASAYADGALVPLPAV